MSLTLYFHPLSSFCWKALIALYEADAPFEPKVVDLNNPAERAAFQAIWPLGKFPILRDEARGRTVPESTVIIDYLVRNYPMAAGLIPADRALAQLVRLLDRLIDNYIHLPFQRIVSQRRRRDGGKAPFIAEQARTDVWQGYYVLTSIFAEPWAVGQTFTLADCAARRPSTTPIPQSRLPIGLC